MDTTNAAASNSTFIIGHRGASYDAPENTLASINLAWRQNIPAVEIDIYLTLDGEIVAIHDADTLRTGGVKKVIKESTLQELKTLDLGAFKGESWIGEQIPTLSEVLKTVPNGGKLFVEIKCGEELIPRLKECLAEGSIQTEQVIFICFSLPTLAAVKKELPQHVACLLSGFKQNKETGEWTPKAEELISQAISADLDGLDLRACDAIDEAFAKKIREAGLCFYVWTVNEIDLAARMRSLGVDGITTDRPLWISQNLGLVG